MQNRNECCHIKKEILRIRRKERRKVIDREMYGWIEKEKETHPSSILPCRSRFCDSLEILLELRGAMDEDKQGVHDYTMKRSEMHS